MTIVYKNFKIECEEQSFTLYFTDKDKETIIGYYSSIYGALKGIYTKLQGNKKTKKSPDKELLNLIHEYKEINKKLTYLSNLVYKPIDDLNKAINGIRKV